VEACLELLDQAAGWKTYTAVRKPILFCLYAIAVALITLKIKPLRIATLCENPPLPSEALQYKRQRSTAIFMVGKQYQDHAAYYQQRAKNLSGVEAFSQNDIGQDRSESHFSSVCDRSNAGIQRF